ncbi:MAG TPA: hypothetical protein DD412_07070 [Holosporales bacterium]|nr:hypothetical protein [Holosporales bacterium]
MPRAISLKQSFTVKGGDVEVHFRDADHLRAVVKRTPLFSGKNTYYILDADVEDGKEFQASGGTGYWEKFVHVEGDEALQIKGYIGYMPFALILPEGSAYGNLTMTGFASRISIAGLNEPLKLLDYLVGISDDSITVQKEEALSLLAERCLDRETHSEKYPSLEKVAPKSILLSDGYIDSSQMDYVASENMPFYVGPDKVSLLSLKKALPLVFGGLFFIDSTLTSSGIYTDKSLCLEKGFSVSTLSNLVVYGDLSLKEYCVKITSGKNIWFIAASLRAASIEICPGVGFMQLPCSFFMERPENMPTELWDAFFKFRFQRTSYTI